ncbi:MAG: DUF4080 domain-containing protein, partial [Sideroxydans sp.]|nr:DUF4080 domain-containing protein [Sideroxydans sp.]
ARYWDLVGNSGRFAKTLPLLLDESPFARFLTFSDWLYATTRKTHQIPLPQLFDLLFTGLTTVLAVAPETARATLEQDFLQSGSKEMPLFLRNEKDNPRQNRAGNPAKRQARLQAE